MTRDETLASLGRVMAQQHGVRLTLVFGSFARGSATERSDIDLAVDGADADMLETSAAVTRALGREADVVALRDAGVPLLEEILVTGSWSMRATLMRPPPGAPT
jgi:predicted nucleotidyltransferase